MLDTLDVIKYDLRVFQITTGLHLFDQVHPRSGPHLRHLKNKYLVQVRVLSRKLVLLNVGLVVTAFEHGDAVHDSKSPDIPECGHVVLNTWGVHVLALIKNRD
jgi:hypothetical protein